MKLFIHPLYFLLGAALIILGRGYDFMAYTATIIIHEMAHAAVAKKFGYALDDIRIMPYGAAVGGNLEGLKPKEEIIIALAGPAVNITAAVVFTALWWVWPATYFFTEALVLANLANALCNLLPVYPLDGGRILSAALRLKKPRARANKIIRITGIILSLLLASGAAVSAFFGFNITLCVMAVFIFFSAVFNYRSDGYSRIYERTYRSKSLKRGITTKEILISASANLTSALRHLSPEYYCRFTIVDANLKPIKTLTETELEELAAKTKSEKIKEKKRPG